MAASPPRRQPPAERDRLPTGPPRLQSPWPRAAILLTPLLFWIFCQPFRSATDPDYWWHVRTGQLIAETGGIPRTDPYSFTAAGQPWVAHEWLTELMLFAVARGGGYAAAAALFGGLAAL